ncbi:MAG TPA: MFS transporter [Vicinamibacterales bacterium]|nr:MFS transporter [Vicinamibacterales bacterium]
MDSPAPVPNAWSPLRHPLFRSRWIASIISNVGTWMQDTSATWLMTILTGSPLLIALMQTAASLPVLVLGLPAGAMADILDRRRVLIFWQFWMLAAALVLSVVTLAGGMGPWLLLSLTLLLNVGAAMNNPAWQAIVPELVPRSELAGAISLNSAGYNLARAVGPALGGLVVAAFASVALGAGVTFFINALSFAFVIGVLFAWKRPPARASALPAERMVGSIRAGARYVRHSQPIRRILVRTFLVTSGVSAMWALLAVVAQQDLARGALGYGLLNASLGTGAILGAISLARLRRLLSSDAIITWSTIVFAITLFVMAFVHHVWLVVIALLAGGFAWTSTTSTFNIAVQISAPPWVQARLLGTYQMTFQAGMAIGSACWGWIAEHTSTPLALSAAAVGLLIALPFSRRHEILAGVPRDLTSAAAAKALGRSAPTVVIELDPDTGPVMISVSYEIDPADEDGFIAAIHDLRAIRLRDGAMRWGLFRDSADARRFVETFLVESWTEYLRQRERLTMSDREVRDRVYAFQRGPIPPPVSRMIYTPTSS